MFSTLHLCLAVLSTSLAVLVWRARPDSDINRTFAAAVILAAIWTLAILGAHSGLYPEASLRLSFASASLIPAAFLAFAHAYPTQHRWPPRLLLRATFALGVVFAALSLATQFIAYDLSLTPAGALRKTGPLYPLFATYCLLALLAASAILIAKWRNATGLARARLQYLAVGAAAAIGGALTTNLILPLLTGRSVYSWFGPYFLLPFIILVAHAIIRHHLMDLRVVIHQSLTIALATGVSLIPVGILLAVFWPQVSSELHPSGLIILVGATAIATLLVPPTRDIAERLLDRYVYRMHSNFQRTVRETSRVLTDVLDLKTLLPFVARAITASIEPEGLGVYLGASRFKEIFSEPSHPPSHVGAPHEIPEEIAEALEARRDPIVTGELARERDPERQRLHAELARLNWALVLPLLSENAVIGAIVVGPKRSGDPFYPHDLDLLMTLANQAGIAIKNAQLYTQVVLANEYIENIVATIESGVVAIDAEGQVTMFNRAAEALTGLAAERVRGQAVEALPAALAGLLRGTVADGQARTEPEIALPDGTRTRPVICTTSPLRDPAGTILGAVAVFSDLTPLKELEVERRRAERLAYFEILASSLAHEIKNPLVAIKTFAQLMPRRHRDERFVGEFSRVVTREMGRIERLVERLRTLSRPSDRPKQPVDVRAPVAEAVEFLRPAFEEKRITLSLSLGGEPRVVLGDHGELEGLFINLLMNAHEATPPEGNVSVDLAATDDRIVVVVADSGPGIPPELLEHVFDPFFTTRPRGSGLGLTISAGIATAHRAKLRVANRPQGGALFTVEFPLAAMVEAPVHEDGSAHHVG